MVLGLYKYAEKIDRHVSTGVTWFRGQVRGKATLSVEAMGVQNPANVIFQGGDSEPEPWRLVKSQRKRPGIGGTCRTVWIGTGQVPFEEHLGVGFSRSAKEPALVPRGGRPCCYVHFGDQIQSRRGKTIKSYLMKSSSYRAKRNGIVGTVVIFSPCRSMFSKENAETKEQRTSYIYHRRKKEKEKT